MSGARMACQGQADPLTDCSAQVRYPMRLYKLLWYVSRRGIGETMQFLRFRAGGGTLTHEDGEEGHAQGGNTAACEERINLLPGELVTVRPEGEILATLDSFGRHQGMRWMPMMREYCGKTFPVYKRVDRIILENTGEIRKVRNTVLLDGVLCKGLYGCDRSCFHFWREAWLKRVSG